MPTPTARALEHQDHANDTRTAKPAASPFERPRRERARSKPAAKHAPAPSTKRATAPTEQERSLTVASAALGQAKKSASPLLIGAGIGAAVALSVVALKGREKQPTVALFASPNSTFFNAMVKTVAFAVARSAAKGSIASLVARAVGKAVA